MPVKSIDAGNIEVQYSVSGEGTPVLLLHGFGEDSSVWNNMVPHLEKDHKVIVPVIPGSGGTEMHSSGMLEDHAEWINKLVEAEGIEKFTFIGHSMGGYIMLAYAEKFPEKLKAIGLFHSSAFADDEDKITTRRKAIEFIRKNGASAFMETSTPNLFMDTEKSKADINSLLEKGRKFKPEALIQYYEAMIARKDRTAVLKEATIPVLFIIGEHDKAVPFESALKQTHMPAEAYIHILRQSGHMGMYEEPERSAEILVNFLKEIEQR